MEKIDGLPPEARFLLRAHHAGLSLEEAGGLIALEEAEAGKRLRAALVRAGIQVPAAAAGSRALLEAATPLVSAAGAPPERAPATACLTDGVAAALGTGGLAGPLLLASAEHSADCPECLARVLAARARGSIEEPPAPRRPRVAAATLVLLALGALVLALLLFA